MVAKKKKNRTTSKKKAVKQKVDKSKFAKLESSLKKSEQRKESFGKDNMDRLTKLLQNTHTDMLTRRAWIRKRREEQDIKRRGFNPRKRNYWCKGRRLR